MGSLACHSARGPGHLPQAQGTCPRGPQLEVLFPRCSYVAARSLAAACGNQFSLFLGGPKGWTACERQN